MKSNCNLLRRLSSITLKLLEIRDSDGVLIDADKPFYEENTKCVLLCCLLEVWTKYQMWHSIFKR